MTLPVLSCIFLDAKKNNTLTLKATNLDLGAEVIIPAKVTEEGAVAVSPSILGSFISNLNGSEQNITLKVIQGNLEIKTPKTSGTIKTMSHEDFPNIPKIVDGNKFTISPVDFIKGLKSVWYCASVSGISPELSSVYVYCEPGFIVFAATDKFRLAEKKIKMKKEVDFGQILIPFKNISEIIRVLEKVSDDVDVELNKNQISFTHKAFYLVSRVVDGIFPDYRQIIPKDKSTEVLVLKQDLVNTLKLSHVFSDKFNQVNFKILPAKGVFEVTTKNNDVGEAINTIDAEISGKDVDINFNYRYIADSFQSIDADSMTLSFSDAVNGFNRPMVMRPVADASFTYIVMPMNR